MLWRLGMSFSSNPLSLSVPDAAFDSWLRDSGYLEILDQRTSDLHRHSSAAPPARPTPTAAAPLATGFFISLFSRIATLLSIFTLNPFAKLSAADFSGPTPSWTTGFLGFFESYSFPSSPAQARLRVHENAKRYARNYASLFVLFFVCTLYVLLFLLLIMSIDGLCAADSGLDVEIVVFPVGCELGSVWFYLVGMGRVQVQAMKTSIC